MVKLGFEFKFSQWPSQSIEPNPVNNLSVNNSLTVHYCEEEQRSSTPGLEGHCPVTFRCVPGQTLLNKMTELPPQYPVKFC